jgi:hypothetical protein
MPFPNPHGVEVGVPDHLSALRGSDAAVVVGTSWSTASAMK